jgi:hypothetical protein
MDPKARREYIRRVAQRYKRAKCIKAKTKLIAEVQENTGYHRKHIIRLLNDPPPKNKPKQKRKRRVIYGDKVIKALLVVWNAADYACAQLVHPKIAEWLRCLEHHGHLKADQQTKRLMLKVSRSTMERIFTCHRHLRPKNRYFPRRRSRSVLAKAVPIEVLPEPAFAPGYIDTDLVQHDGGEPSGTFINTVNFKDRYSFWICRLAIWGKRHDRVLEAVKAACQNAPFTWLQLHFDGGGEFINYRLLGHCKKHKINYTRSRPYKSNDNARIENSNRYDVRRCLGYRRLDQPQLLELIARLYLLADLYYNFFHAAKRLTHTQIVIIDDRKHRRKYYDHPDTPYKRLKTCSTVSKADKTRLTRIYNKLDPLDLLTQIRQLILAIRDS